jgi:putative spermidine/putrescine transport system substrate-binding protein
MSTLSRPTRRDLMALGAASGLSAAMTPLVATSARAGGTINFADIGVGDPDGDWSRYSKASGFNVNLVAIGNAPSAILNTLVAGGGTASYDVINIVGGMQKPLVDTAQLPNWVKDKNIGEFLGKGKPGFNFIDPMGRRIATIALAE